MVITASVVSLLPSTILLNRGRGRGRGRCRYIPPFLSSSSRLVSQSSSAAASVAAARNTANTNTNSGRDVKRKNVEQELEEEEENVGWIQPLKAKAVELKEKAVELKEQAVEQAVELVGSVTQAKEQAVDQAVELVGSVTQAIPGPRVGRSPLPWIVAIPLAYAFVSFLIALPTAVRNFNSPKAIRRSKVNKNAMLCKSIDELLEKGRDGVKQSTLEGLKRKTGFGMGAILRKYIRYALNEKPFNPDLVANIIQLRKASSLDDSQIAQILNEISRRIVKDKGLVVMDMSGYSEKGFKRKIAVQTLFGKVYYLSELPEFCSRDNSLHVKEIFGVAEEDAEKLRIHTLSEAGDLDSLEKMIDDISDSEYSPDCSSNAP